MPEASLTHKRKRGRVTPMTPMQAALSEAQKAYENGEVPVGAVIADAAGTLIACAHNQVEAEGNPTAHAEMLALAAARAQRLRSGGERYLEDCSLYVTLEPCAMCAQAIAYHRLKAVYFGAYDPKSGGTENGARIFAHSHHKPDVYGGIMEEECAALLKKFFEERRT